MKKTGILNNRISKTVADMGHGDLLVIADAGLPISPDVEKIDVALMPGKPSFLETLECVLLELQVEKVIIAEEMNDVSPAIFDSMSEVLPGVEVIRVPHEEFKVMTKNARAVIRSGEFTPYANVILVSGVVF